MAALLSGAVDGAADADAPFASAAVEVNGAVACACGVAGNAAAARAIEMRSAVIVVCNTVLGPALAATTGNRSVFFVMFSIASWIDALLLFV